MRARTTRSDDHAPERLAVAVVVLAAAACATVVTAMGRDPRELARAEAFHRATGGLGGGTATALTPCAGAFDPSIDATCGAGLDPAPGGFAFCPHHAGPALAR